RHVCDRRAGCCTSEDERSRLVRFPAEYQIRLIEESASKLYDNVPRGLDVHGTLHHGHQSRAERNQVWRDVGILVADRSRMDAWDEKSRQLEQTNRRFTDERQIEVARAGTIRIEGCVIVPPVAGN